MRVSSHNHLEEGIFVIQLSGNQTQIIILTG